jgi:hypothetical protein
MSRPNPRKAAKRREKLAHKRQWAARCDARARRPEAVFDPGGAPPEFTRPVEAAVRAIWRDPDHHLPADLVDDLQFAKQEGFPALYQHLANTMPLEWSLVDLRSALSALNWRVGEALFAALPAPWKAAHLATNGVRVKLGQPRLDQIRIACRSLLREKSPDGTLYYAPHRPQVAGPDGPRTVAFSAHAIQRIAERAVIDPHGYCGSNAVFLFLYHCVFYDDVTDACGQPAIGIYDACWHDPLCRQYVPAILGQSAPYREVYFFRLGYCPTAAWGGYAKAKTLLVPGMAGTPEARLIQKAALSPTAKAAWRDRVGRLSMSSMALNPDFSLLKWFHEQGVPQVVAIDRPVFVYD